MTTMYYFGPLKESGHHLFNESGWVVYKRDLPAEMPWKLDDLDGKLQPGRVLWRDHWIQQGQTREGDAVLHQKDGWTALSIWDYSVDTRPGSHSTYIANGIFSFDEMVELAKTRFAERWNKMKFTVQLYDSSSP